MKEYLFPLVTDELRIAFCQATAPLCNDVQRIIWEEVVHCTVPIEAPPAPKNAKYYTLDCRFLYPETCFIIEAVNDVVRRVH